MVSMLVFELCSAGPLYWQSQILAGVTGVYLSVFVGVYLHARPLACLLVPWGFMRLCHFFCTFRMGVYLCGGC